MYAYKYILFSVYLQKIQYYNNMLTLNFSAPETGATEEIKDKKDEVIYNNSTVIRSVDNNQFRILRNIMKLYGIDKIDVDPTYSIGNFYKKQNVKGEIIQIPDPTYKFDVYPQAKDVVKIEPLTSWPLKDSSCHCINVDLPFVISPHNAPSAKDPKDGSCITQQRFASFYPVQELFETYYFFLKECYRILDDDGILIWKSQNSISAQKQINTPEMSWFFAESIGFDMVDKFVLTAEARLLSSKHSKQQHSRRFESYFLVFKKSQKKKTKYLTFDNETIMRNIVEGFFNNNFKNIPKYQPK